MLNTVFWILQNSCTLVLLLRELHHVSMKNNITAYDFYFYIAANAKSAASQHTYSDL